MPSKCSWSCTEKDEERPDDGGTPNPLFPYSVRLIQDPMRVIRDDRQGIAEAVPGGGEDSNG